MLKTIYKLLFGKRKQNAAVTLLLGKKRRKRKKYARDYIKDQNYYNPNKY